MHVSRMTIRKALTVAVLFLFVAGVTFADEACDQRSGGCPLAASSAPAAHSDGQHHGEACAAQTTWSRSGAASASSAKSPGPAAILTVAWAVPQPIQASRPLRGGRANPPNVALVTTGRLRL